MIPEKLPPTIRRRVYWDWRRRQWVDFQRLEAWYWYKFEPRAGSPGQWVAVPL